MTANDVYMTSVNVDVPGGVRVQRSGYRSITAPSLTPTQQ